MELSAVVAAYTQIVSLMADYAGQKSSRDALSVQEFTEWMTTHGHADLIRAIERNQAMTVSVKAAFAEGRDELLDRIRALDEKVSSITAGLGPLDDMANAIHPESALSAQAREILCAFEQQQATEALESHRREGPALIFVGGTNAGLRFKADEPRFYEDDLNLLVDRGYLSLSHGKSGGRIFRPTRIGSQIGKQLLSASTRNQ